MIDQQTGEIKEFVVNNLTKDRGGKTVLSNAALICAKCNKSKGARKKARRRHVA
jgi:5-methylcytosine-specific restriction endonuclease McrA